LESIEIAESSEIVERVTGEAHLTFVLVIYVHVLNIICTKQAVAMAKQMMEIFETKDLGKLSQCIGLQVEHYGEGIFVHQSSYLQNILKKYGMENCNPIATPLKFRGDRELYGDRKEGEPMCWTLRFHISQQ
jgi:hypothetical protein